MNENNILYSDGALLAEAAPPQQSNQYDRAIQEKKVSNFISQTSPTNSLIKIDWLLKGFVYNEQNTKWEKIAAGIPDEIRLDAIQALSPHLSEDVRMGRLAAEQINDIMESMIEWMMDYLDSKADSYIIDNNGKWILKEEANQMKERQISIQGYDTEIGYVYTYNNKEYEFRDRGARTISEEDLSKIAWIIWSAIFYTLSRARDGVERDRMYNVLKLGDNLSDYAKEDKSKGILDSFLPWK
jgi:hypothetical protein